MLFFFAANRALFLIYLWVRLASALQLKAVCDRLFID